MSDSVRTDFVLPRALLEDFDRFVEPLQRSERVAELMAEWLRRERSKELARQMAGLVTDDYFPEFAPAEDVYRWVRQFRETGALPSPASRMPGRRSEVPGEHIRVRTVWAGE